MWNLWAFLCSSPDFTEFPSVMPIDCPTKKIPDLRLPKGNGTHFGYNSLCFTRSFGFLRLASTHSQCIARETTPKKNREQRTESSSFSLSRVALKSVCKWFKVDTFTHRASIQPSNTIERPSRQTRFRFPRIFFWFRERGSVGVRLRSSNWLHAHNKSRREFCSLPTPSETRM